MCEHVYKGIKCTELSIIGSKFCTKHKCKSPNCKNHRVGFEKYKGKRDEYGIWRPSEIQVVEYCSFHRCDYIFSMGNPLGVKCKGCKKTCIH